MSSRGYLVDTNVVSLALNGKSPTAVQRLSAQPRASIAISVITEMELRFGLARHQGHRLRPAIEVFLDTVTISPLPADIAKVYGVLRADLERLGKQIGPLDTIIAAHAIAAGAVLVTNNVREFGRVRGLRCEDWTKG